MCIRDRIYPGPDPGAQADGRPRRESPDHHHGRRPRLQGICRRPRLARQWRHQHELVAPRHQLHRHRRVADHGRLLQGVRGQGEGGPRLYPRLLRRSHGRDRGRDREGRLDRQEQGARRARQDRRDDVLRANQVQCQRHERHPRPAAHPGAGQGDQGARTRRHQERRPDADQVTAPTTSHSGARRRREPGIHNPRRWLWIPGSLAALGPRNDGPANHSAGARWRICKRS